MVCQSFSKIWKRNEIRPFQEKEGSVITHKSSSKILTFPSWASWFQQCLSWTHASFVVIKCYVIQLPLYTVPGELRNQAQLWPRPSTDWKISSTTTYSLTPHCESLPYFKSLSSASSTKIKWPQIKQRASSSVKNLPSPLCLTPATKDRATREAVWQRQEKPDLIYLFSYEKRLNQTVLVYVFIVVVVFIITCMILRKYRWVYFFHLYPLTDLFLSAVSLGCNAKIKCTLISTAALHMDTMLITALLNHRITWTPITLFHPQPHVHTTTIKQVIQIVMKAFLLTRRMMMLLARKMTVNPQNIPSHQKTLMDPTSVGP